MIIGLDMRRADKVYAARVENDQFRAFAEPPFHVRGEYRMPIRGVCPDNHDDIGLVHRIEILGSRRRAKSGPEAIAGRRMADPRASVDIVITETGSDQFLNDK